MRLRFSEIATRRTLIATFFSLAQQVALWWRKIPLLWEFAIPADFIEEIFLLL